MSNKTGTQSVYVGNQAGAWTESGESNVAIGMKAAMYAKAMTRTIAIGDEAGSGSEQSTSTDDIFIGYQAGKANTTGTDNVFVGNKAGLKNTTGSRNIFIGDSCGVHATEGNTNIFLGSGAGYFRYRDFGNICIGTNAGYRPFNGKLTGAGVSDNNIYIGHNCGGFEGSSNVIIGNFSNIDDSELRPRPNTNDLPFIGPMSIPKLTQKQIADSAENGRTFAVVNNGDALLMGSFKTKKLVTGGELTVLGNILPGTKADFGGLGDPVRTLGSSNRKWNEVYAIAVYGDRIYANNTQLTSDRRLKTDIRPLENALAKVMKLNGVTYKWRTDEFKERGFDENRHAGVIAQEVEAVLPEAVETGADGYKSVSYNDLTPLLIEAIKELKAEKDELKQQVDELKKLLEQLMKK